ncbi:MAG: tol-pal system-associated acyl-CoA thioesterase [Alphaproteobacteria bacterium]|nr:tol-pal system-associated acyl-CoA thioesterase [Alphaproteobacteria bacterium]
MVEAPAAATHITPIRVYYEDTDAAGIVYYANYLNFAERARTEMMRDLADGLYARMLADGMAFVVRRCTVDYAGAAKLDDLVEVQSRVLNVGGASLSAEQTVWRDGERLVAMEVKLGCIGSDGRPARIPADLRAAIEKHA